MDPHLVAFIDILGFGSELKNVRSEEDLKAIRKKMLFVQREFAKSSAFNEPSSQEVLNQNYGKRVLALSDAVVVAINLNCVATAKRVIDIYDLVGSSIWDLIAAQGRCACNGIFVRGGISHGPFYFENDVLLSPALAEAYAIESKRADYPVIAITDRTVRWIRNLPKRHKYAPGADPVDSYFRGYEAEATGELLFLDYMRVLVNEQHRGMVSPEREAYNAARRRKQFDKADRIFDRSVLKDAAFFLRLHRCALEAAYRSTNAEKVAKKYRWLMRYHNASFRTDLPYLPQQRIDLRRFRPKRG